MKYNYTVCNSFVWLFLLNVMFENMFILLHDSIGYCLYYRIAFHCITDSQYLSLLVKHS